MADEAIKACATCGQVKAATDFHKNKFSSDGLRSACKPCVLLANRASVLRHHEKRKAEKRSAIGIAYSARRRSQDAGGISTADLAKWKSAQPKCCYWCSNKRAKEYTVDHYVPLSKGGRHIIGNLVIACRPCNVRKNAKDPLDFAREVGRLL